MGIPTMSFQSRKKGLASQEMEDRVQGLVLEPRAPLSPQEGQVARYGVRRVVTIGACIMPWGGGACLCVDLLLPPETQ